MHLLASFRGACGEVKLAIEKESCDKYAVKIITKKNFSVGVGMAGRPEHPNLSCKPRVL